ncbi:hypothetical protein GCM10009751_11750 [Myceligenerans crystallogenes]|uniref:DUF4349 domain-containing protein n=1 Tax=Myceligenerans crystallogenes TaxID=316335 RepID=A0ABP4ZGK4_9MICO
MAALCAGLLAVTLAGCGADAADGSGAAPEGVAAPEAAFEEGAADAAGGRAADEDGGEVGVDVSGQEQDIDRELVTTGEATLVVDDPFAAAEEVAELTEKAGGRVESRDETAASGEEPGSAWLTLRIPAGEVTATLDAFARLGEVTERSIQTVDVTGQARDLDARIAALETSTRRLTELLADADRTADLIEIERELSDRQATLDSLTGERELLSDQVAMSTLNLSIRAGQAPVAEARPEGFLGGLAAGWDGLVGTFNVLVLVLGALLPWAAVAAVLFLIARPLVRRARANRRRATLPDPS